MLYSVAMRYILTAGWDDGVADLTERLVRELAQGKRVLWLVSGGSNTWPEVEVMSNISRKLSQNLTVMLADERYGPVGHAESNWAQLMEAGFKGGKATLLPILQADLSFQQTIKHYNRLVSEAFAEHNIIIAQLGIGTDGHIAGIRVDSSMVNKSQALVCGYKSSENPPLKRMTLTFHGLRHIDVAYTFAFGVGKQKALNLLQAKSLPLTQQPAQILKDLREAYVYNDQVG